MNFERWIIVRFDFIGFHFWAAAPDDIAYLRLNHRHKFMVELEVSVKHDDREVEFHQLLRVAKNYLGSDKDKDVELGMKSCEMLAEEFIVVASQTYGDERRYRCTIWEDGEVGARVEYTPPTISLN